MASAHQNELVQQLKGVLDIRDEESARALLEASSWNLEAALATVFDDAPSTLPSSESHADDPRFEPMQVDDSAQQQPIARNVSSIVLYILSSTVSFFARIFGIRPNIPSFSIRPLLSSGSASTVKLDPRQCSERLVRELEEDTGAASSYSTLATGVQQSSASTTVYPVASTSKSSASSNPLLRGKKLPNFHIGSYDSALSFAKDRIRPLCVILISSEHQDTEEFKRTNLVDPDLVATFEQRNFVVWIGDIKYADSYQTSRILETTTFPFFAFITLQPPRSIPGLNPSSVPKMTVFSRLEGPPSTVTSANAIISHINNTLIPRTSSYMDRLKKDRQARDQERQMRSEQDRAYEEAGRKDIERIKAKQEKLESERKAKEQEKKTEQEKTKQSKMAEQWRAWARKELIPLEPTSLTSSATARLSVKLPDGQRLIRKFPKEATLLQVYAWVECEAYPASTKADDMISATKPSNHQHSFEFQMSTLFPKKVLSKQELDKTLEQVGGLVPDASVVVEGLKVSTAEESDDEEIVSEEE